MSYSRRAETAELSVIGEAILTLLAHHQGPPRSTQSLARTLHVSSGTITQTAKTLRDRGLIEYGGKRGNQFTFRVTADGQALVSLLDEAEVPSVSPAPAETNGSMEPEVNQAPSIMTRETMEADIWAWANAVTPRVLAEMARGTLTQIWEATQ